MSDSTEIVRTTPPAVAVNPFQASNIFDPGSLNVWTSFDPTTEDGKVAIIRHMQGDDAGRVVDAINTIVEVQHVLAHRIELVDQKTGEISEADRLVLVREDGSSIACVSAGIRRSLQTIFPLYGLPPYNPPLRLQIKQKETRQGHRTYLLLPVARIATEPASAKKK